MRLVSVLLELLSIHVSREAPCNYENTNRQPAVAAALLCAL